jgi:hypothetical protein
MESRSENHSDFHRHEACFMDRMRNLRRSAIRVFFLSGILVAGSVMASRHVLASSAGGGCPDLVGNYVCPAYGPNQPRSPMAVSESADGEVTTYTYTFKNLHPDGHPNDPSASSTRYSVAGIVDDKSVTWKCEGDRLQIIQSDLAKPIQEHFREKSTGDYVVVRVARDAASTSTEVQRCVNAD